MRGRRYTAPPLTSTCSVVCRSYKTNISAGRKSRKRKLANAFHDALVPFAERRIIKMKLAELREADIIKEGQFQINTTVCRKYPTNGRSCLLNPCFLGQIFKDPVQFFCFPGPVFESKCCFLCPTVHFVNLLNYLQISCILVF